MTQGEYIIVHTPKNKYFDVLERFVLANFDIPKHAGKAIILLDYIWHSADYFRGLYPGRKIVFYNWEQMVSNNNYFNVAYPIAHMKTANEVWDFDYTNAEFLRWNGVVVDAIYPFRYTEVLDDLPPTVDNPEIDVLLYGLLSPVRLAKLGKVMPKLYHKVKFMAIANLDRADQECHIANAKIILNLHGIEPYCRQEQERIGYLLNNGKCVVSEVSQVNYFGSAIVEAPLPQLAERILHLCKETNWRAQADFGYYQFKNNLTEIWENKEF